MSISGLLLDHVKGKGVYMLQQGSTRLVELTESEGEKRNEG